MFQRKRKENLAIIILVTSMLFFFYFWPSNARVDNPQNIWFRSMGDIFFNTGNVGIGTSSPVSELEVAGRITEEGTYGGIHVHDNTTAQSIPTGMTYTKITPFTDNNISSNVTPDSSNDKITLTEKGVYQVHASLNFMAGTPNVEIRCTTFLNNVEQDSIHIVRDIATANSIASASFTGTMRVSSIPIDADVRCRHDSGGSVNITFEYANFNLFYLGE